jgi:hypothetical protein
MMHRTGQRLLLVVALLAGAILATRFYSNEPTDHSSSPAVENATPQHANSTDASSAAPRERETSEDRGGIPPEYDSREGAGMVADAVLGGREIADSIDWNSIPFHGAIPRSMPARESDDPLDAGFAPQWIQRAFDPSWGLASLAEEKGRRLVTNATSLAMKIVSEKKRGDDVWAYGVEHEIRRVIREEIGTPLPTTLRVFCNAHGCMCYFEGADALKHVSALEGALWRDTWAKDFGIVPLHAFDIAAGGGQAGPRWWMFFVSRERPEGAIWR